MVEIPILGTSERIIVVDLDTYAQKSFFATLRAGYSVEYNILRLIFSSLVKLKFNKKDLVIVAAGSSDTWRKEAIFTEPLKDIDSLFFILDVGTPFHIVKVPSLAARDIISVVARSAKEKEVIICSSNRDIEQLLALKNCKLYSERSKKFKIVKDPLSFVSKKIFDLTKDNLASPAATQQDYENCKMLVNLLSLPKEIEDKAVDVLSKLKEKIYDFNFIPYFSLVEHYKKLFE